MYSLVSSRTQRILRWNLVRVQICCLNVWTSSASAALEANTYDAIYTRNCHDNANLPLFCFSFICFCNWKEYLIIIFARYFYNNSAWRCSWLLLIDDFQYFCGHYNINMIILIRTYFILFQVSHCVIFTSSSLFR